MNHSERTMSLKVQKKTQSVLGWVLQWRSRHAYWIKRKTSSQSNQKLMDKIFFVDMKICIINMTCRTILLQHTQNEISLVIWVHSWHHKWSSINAIKMFLVDMEILKKELQLSWTSHGLKQPGSWTKLSLKLQTLICLDNLIYVQ